jgi:hypothetical protein|tara:strand:- start:431 stop:556 length:126 start_codon:yes stop_codon:yes gene_type:complete
MTTGKVIPLPKLTDLDEQFIILEAQKRKVERQKKLIEEMYK